MAAIHHIVLFKFKPSASAEEVKAACDRMLALQTNCLHPETRQPYVKAAIGGRNNSPEGKSHGFEHAFISQFENEEDRTYYLESDPAHKAFGESLDGLVEDAHVVDFTPGVF